MQHLGPPPEFWVIASLGALGLGMLSLIPVWIRERALRSGRVTRGHEDVFMRNVTCSLLLLGSLGLLSQAVLFVGRTLSFWPFMIFCGAGLGVLCLIAARVDAKACR